jgi:hypothetical protein
MLNQTNVARGPEEKQAQAEKRTKYLLNIFLRTGSRYSSGV